MHFAQKIEGRRLSILIFDVYQAFKQQMIHINMETKRSFN